MRSESLSAFHAVATRRVTNGGTADPPRRISDGMATFIRPLRGRSSNREIERSYYALRAKRALECGDLSPLLGVTWKSRHAERSPKLLRGIGRIGTVTVDGALDKDNSVVRVADDTILARHVSAGAREPPNRIPRRVSDIQPDSKLQITPGRPILAFFRAFRLVRIETPQVDHPLIS